MIRPIIKTTLFVSVILFVGQFGWCGETIGSRFHRNVMAIWAWGSAEFAKSAYFEKLDKMPFFHRLLSDWSKRASAPGDLSEERGVVAKVSP